MPLIQFYLSGWVDPMDMMTRLVDAQNTYVVLYNTCNFGVTSGLALISRAAVE